MKSICTFLFLVVLTISGAAQTVSSDQRYLEIYGVIEKADQLKDKGQKESALAKYREAYEKLQKFKHENPTWNNRLVSRRLTDLANTITTLSKPPETPGDSDASTSNQTAGGSTKVQILDEGADPKRELRIQAKTGDQQTLVMNIKMSMDAGMGPAMKMPAFEVPMDIAVKEVSDAGDITYEMTVKSPKVIETADDNPQLVAAIKMSMDGIEGYTTSGKLSSRGEHQLMDAEMPATANPQLRQTMEQMNETLGGISIVFPEKAIGPGAKWEVKQPLQTQGLKVDQTTTYEVVSIDGDRVNLKSTVVQSASNQKMENPGMPGMKLDLSKMTGRGEGTIESDLSRAFPVKASGNVGVQLNLSMNLGGQKQSVVMKQDVEYSLESN